MVRTMLFAFMSVLLSANLLSAQDTYVLDVAHSKVEFTVTHMMLSQVTGKFREFSGKILYDEDDMSKWGVSVDIKTASIFTDNEKRDNHLRSDDFFNAEKFPLITFRSKRFEKRGDQYVAVGDLTIRDVTKQVEIPFKITGHIKDPWGNIRIGAVGSLTINRQDYGVKWSKSMDMGGVVVSDEVKISLSVEGIKQTKTSGK